ncbi:MAG: hypothetical protein U0903_07035 [Planctomycetales bacterium]
MRLSLLLIGFLLSADPVTPESKSPAAPKPADPFVDRVVSYRIGSGGGKNKEKLPGIVLGPPKGRGKLRAGTDVFSLGSGGEIVLEFTDNEVFDGPGPDFIVFENPFLQEPGNDPHAGYFEFGRVDVSEDGVNWKFFPADTGTKKGCAGWNPVLANADENAISPTDPEKAGGEAYDLKDVGLKVVRFVRITDLQNKLGGEGTMGFDLDAVAAVHSRPRTDAKAKQ